MPQNVAGIFCADTMRQYDSTRLRTDDTYTCTRSRDLGQTPQLVFASVVVPGWCSQQPCHGYEVKHIRSNEILENVNSNVRKIKNFINEGLVNGYF